MNDIFNKLAKQEQDFLKTEVFSPVLHGQPIRVKVDGVILELDVVRPKKFQGWGVFKALDFRTAKKVRDASLIEKKNYFKLFPSFRVVVCSRTNNVWKGIPANQSSGKIQVEGQVPISLAEDIQLFDTIVVRFDGINFWYEEKDLNRSPRIADQMRVAVADMVGLNKLNIAGMSKEEQDAYNIALINEIKNRKDLKEERLKLAIHRAGGSYVSYVERNNEYTVTYTVDGQRHHSTVDKENLSVQNAGICLSGRDGDFDLQSLVGVIREGIEDHAIYRTEAESPYPRGRG